jgi:hypothetical protein
VKFRKIILLRALEIGTVNIKVGLSVKRLMRLNIRLLIIFMSVRLILLQVRLGLLGFEHTLGLIDFEGIATLSLYTNFKEAGLIAEK